MDKKRKQKQLLKKIDTAKNDVSAAENELEQVLSQIDVAPRAQKTTVSRVVENAFSKLREAKADLEKLETLLAPK